MVVEKSLDDKSKAAIADFDVAAYYDEHSLIKLLAWMLDHSFPLDVAVAAIRLHAFPPVRLKCGQERFLLTCRSRGTLTGSRSANELARIPVQQSIVDALPAVRNLGYPCDDFFLLAMTYVDNVFAAGSCSAHATSICDAFAHQLRQKWKQRVKPDSRHLLPIDASDLPSDDKWTIVFVLDCLATSSPLTAGSEPHSKGRLT
jgi:hypothetical protein